MPIAATTQIVAALVRPTTAPRAWRIVPAPIKPTPVTICAATRVVSVPAGITPVLAVSIASERCVYSTDPMQIRMLVRSPAGLPPSSRSRPMAPPSSVARPSCSMRSRRKIWTIRVNTSPMEESHLVAHVSDRAVRQLTCFFGSATKPFHHSRRIILKAFPASAYRRESLDHIVRQHALAVETAPARSATFVGDLGDGLRRRKSLVQRVNVADLGRPVILACLFFFLVFRRPPRSTLFPYPTLSELDAQPRARMRL